MHFPIFIELSGRNVLVVGAGAIAARRIGTLVPFGARIRILAPQCGPETQALLEKYRADGCLTYEKRKVCQADIKGADLVLTATGDRQVNHQVVTWCRQAGVMVNAADQKEECDFYFPAIARKGVLTAGICADGQDHGLVKRAAARVRSAWEAEDPVKEDDHK